MKIVFSTIILLVLLAANIAAQTEKCDLTLKDAPNLLNIRLEMSPQETQEAFGGKLKVKVKKEGTFFQNYIDKKPPSFLPNVRAVYLRFFDRKLYQIEIFYQPQTERRTLAEFTEQLSAQLNLPANLWTTEYGKASLVCADFSLVADNVLNPRVQLTDEAIRARFDAAQESKKRK
ncbi:MAG: hypothetical protein ACR2IA_04070 [Pyrinomonadaceae bacterium]